MNFSPSRMAVHAVLFVTTFATCALAGVQWLNKDPFDLGNFLYGVPYAALLFLILLSHEMGHWFAAKSHNISASLPFFIPYPSFVSWGISPFGTLGAVIRLREPVRFRKALLDVGAAGPMAGFIASTIVLAIGFTTLPPREYIYAIHPDYANLQSIPQAGLTFGTNLLFVVLSKLCSPSGAFIPPMNEIYHYPFLCVGWFGCLLTALNLIPVGQLDGGHIAKAMFSGRVVRLIRRTTIGILACMGTTGILPFLFPSIGILGWMGWLFWAIVLFFATRKSTNTDDQFESQLRIDRARQGIAWLAVVILAITFVPTPFFVY
jgi:membrane-associated protease RseP (regulator of RpoE activity)